VAISQGTDSTILCDWPSRASSSSAVVATALPRAEAASAVKRDFEARHKQQFGFLMSGKSLVVQSVSAEAWVYASDVKEPLRPKAPSAPDATTGRS
jgi:N-methylhydantoinase A/oxoprolinase/acetone carboxylase beta subunit